MDDSLKRLLDRALGLPVQPCGGTAIPGLRIAVLPRRTIPAMTLYDPLMCLVLQGVKQVMIGGSVMRFEAGSCFASTIELPAMGCVLEAQTSRPYVAVALAIDRDALVSLIDEASPPAADGSRGSGFGLQRAQGGLMDAVGHLLGLLDTPQDIPALRAGREREVLYRLLQGGHGDMLRRAVRDGAGAAHVRRAIAWIKQHLDRKLRTQTLAEIAGMSIPSFHRHFKALTAQSPLQYQKTLRLQAARRLLVAGSDTTRAAFSVGYESPSQFSREYARLFGLPPSRDAARMQAGADAATLAD